MIYTVYRMYIYIIHIVLLMIYKHSEIRIIQFYVNETGELTIYKHQ